MTTESRRIKQRAYSKKWRKLHPEKRRETVKKCYLKYRNKILEQCRIKYIRKKKIIDEKHRAYQKSAHFKEVRRKYRALNKQRFRAYSAINNGIRRGKIFKSPCAECGNPKVEAHHIDYNKPLDVIWLCKEHHKTLHRRLSA